MNRVYVQCINGNDIQLKVQVPKMSLCKMLFKIRMQSFTNLIKLNCIHNGTYETFQIFNWENTLLKYLFKKAGETFLKLFG